MNLDREVAEKVMGWCMSTATADPESDTVWTDLKEIKATMDWSPSTNIQHAMEVEAEMFRRGYDCRTGHLHEYAFEDVTVYRVDFYMDKEMRGGAQFISLPEAICRAALAALEGI